MVSVVGSPRLLITATLLSFPAALAAVLLAGSTSGLSLLLLPCTALIVFARSRAQTDRAAASVAYALLFFFMALIYAVIIALTVILAGGGGPI